jgi:PAS domain S-box-containing protein
MAHIGWVNMNRVKASPGGLAALLHFITHALPEPAVLLSPAGEIHACNPAAERVFGYASDELTGKSIDLLLEPGHFSKIAVHLPPSGSVPDLSSLPPASPCTGQHRQRGQIKLLASGILIPEAQEMVLILQLAQAPADPATSQLRYIIENSEEAIFLINEDLSITSWNRGARNTYFYSSAEAFGKPVLDLFPLSEAEQATKLFTSVKEGFAISQYECVQIRSGGAAFEASLSITPFYDAAGEVKGFSMLARDISVRRQAERRLLESEERFRQLAENIAEVFWLCNAEGVLYVSPAYENVFNGSVTNLYSNPQSFLEVIHPDDRHAVQTVYFRDGHLNIEPFDIEYRIVDSNSNVRWVHARTFLVRGNDPAPRLAGISEEITARKLAEQALRISQKNLARAQDIAGLGYWQWDVKKDIMEWSDRIFQIIGRNRETFHPVFTSYLQHVHPDDREVAQARVKACLEIGGQYAITHRAITADGKIRYVKNLGEVEFGLDGTPERMFGIALDVTDELLSENILRESEERFRSIFEQSTLGMAIVLPGGKIERVNDVFCVMLDYSREEFLALELGQLSAKTEESACLDRISKVLAGELDGQVCELVLRKKSGQPIHVELNTSCIRDEEGQPLHLLLQAQDTTERHHTQIELLRSRESLAMAEHLAHLGNWDIDLVNGEVHWSDETYRIYGLNPEHFHPTLDSTQQFIVPGDRDRLSQEIETALAAHSSFMLEARIIRADQQLRYVQFSGMFQYEDDEPVRLIGSLLDISERRMMEDKLRYSEERMQLLSDSASEGVAIHEHGIVINCNNAIERMFGKPLNEIIGSMAVELIHPDDRHISNERIAAREAGAYEARGIRGDGSVFPMLVTALETTTRGKPVRVVLLQDITDRKAAEQAQRDAAAREAEMQMLKLAAATYAHEINNPLTGIRATLQILEDHPLPEEEQELIQQSLQAIERISQVIEKMQQMKDPQFKPYLNREILDIHQDAASGGQEL